MTKASLTPSCQRTSPSTSCRPEMSPAATRLVTEESSSCKTPRTLCSAVASSAATCRSTISWVPTVPIGSPTTTSVRAKRVGMPSREVGDHRGRRPAGSGRAIAQEPAQLEHGGELLGEQEVEAGGVVEALEHLAALAGLVQ